VDDHAPYTGDLNLSAVRTHDELVKLLKRVRVRADNPSLRSLETTTRDFDRPLSKTVVAEMLKGDRFPHLAVMLSFLKACGVPAKAIEPWQRAWERVAETRHQEAQLEEIQRPGTSGATDKTEITRLREQVDRLTADNEKLRLAQLAGEMDDSLSQVSPQSDPGTSHAAPQEHAVRYLELKNTESVQLFYDEMMKFIRKADEAVYIQGKGFHNEKTFSLFEPLIHAEREALLRGAEVIRIHPGNLVAASWAKGYAELADEFDRFLMYSDLDVIYTYDVILIDPHGHRPVVIYLYETRERKSLRPVVKPVSALFVMNAHALAANLADHFIAHIDELSQLRPELQAQEIRDLASTYTYLAWGVHMDFSEMRREVPDARPMGTATVYGWQQNMDAMVSGPADSDAIRHTGKREDFFVGVTYELSWRGKARIDRSDQRAYQEFPVDIELKGKMRPAFIHVPLPKTSETTGRARRRWLDSVEKGAADHKMTDFVIRLREARARIERDGG
jgi:hypothetical protein